MVMGEKLGMIGMKVRDMRIITLVLVGMTGTIMNIIIMNRTMTSNKNS